MTIPRRRPRFYRGEWRDIIGWVLRGVTSLEGYVRRFEEEFASYSGRKFAVAVPSGRVGMELLLDALGIGPGDGVIMSVYTLKDLVVLMQEKGIRPVMANVDRDSFNIDPAKIEEKITPDTRAIVATHIFGVPCEIDRIKEIAARRGLKLIEDCAHALGATFGGNRVGTFGDAAFFSFETTKPVNTFGGGMVVTDDNAVAAKIRGTLDSYPAGTAQVLKKIFLAALENALLRGAIFTLLMRMFVSHENLFTKLYWSFRSRTRAGHSRYTGLQARIGLEQLKMLDVWNESRAAAAALLESGLPHAAVPQKVPEGARRVHYFYVVRTSTSSLIEDVRRRMLASGVDTGIREEITDNCSHIAGGWGEFPVVAELYARNLQLPVYDGLREKDIKHVISALEMSVREENIA